MHKLGTFAAVLVLLSSQAMAGAPGSTGAPGGGAPGAASSSSAASGSGTTEAAPVPGHDGGPRGEMTPEKFAEAKARILAHMDERMAEIQKRKACVQAATDGKGLLACKPEKRGMGERMGDKRGGENKPQ